MTTITSMATNANTMIANFNPALDASMLELKSDNCISCTAFPFKFVTLKILLSVSIDTKDVISGGATFAKKSSQFVLKAWENMDMTSLWRLDRLLLILIASSLAEGHLLEILDMVDPEILKTSSCSSVGGGEASESDPYMHGDTTTLGTDIIALIKEEFKTNTVNT